MNRCGLKVTEQEIAALQKAIDKLNECFDAITALEEEMGIPGGGVEIDNLSELDRADAEGIRFLRRKCEQWLRRLRAMHG